MTNPGPPSRRFRDFFPEGIHLPVSVLCFRLFREHSHRQKGRGLLRLVYGGRRQQPCQFGEGCHQGNHQARFESYSDPETQEEGTENRGRFHAGPLAGARPAGYGVHHRRPCPDRPQKKIIRDNDFPRAFTARGFFGVSGFRIGHAVSGDRLRTFSRQAEGEDHNPYTVNTLIVS